jgi:hypothetical protein
MSNDISLKNDEEFSTDLTKAVQDIADNVKAGSADFTKGLDSLKSSIEAMQSALVTALNSIKVNIVNNYKSESTKTPKERKSPAEDFGPTRKDFEENLKKDVSFAIDLQGYIQSLADDFENALGPAIQSVDPYLLDARSNFRAFQEDLDELAQAAKSVSEPIIEMSDSLAELIKEVDTERIMSKAGPKSLKDVFNIVGASAQPNEQNLPEAIPLSSGGPQSLADVFRIVAAATQDIPKAQRVYTKDEIAEMQNKPKVFAQQATEQTSGPWQTLFSNIGSDIQVKKEQEKQKEQDAIGLASGMSFGPSRELFDEINRAKDIGKSFSESLLNLRNNVASTVPVFGRILKGGPGGSAIEGGIKSIGEGATKMALGAGSGPGIASGAAMAGFGVALVAAGASLNLVANAANIAAGFINTFAQYVSKSNPATMEQVNLVFNDLNGTIGRALNPTIQYLIPLLRYYADFVDASVKTLKPVMETLAIAFATITKPLLDLAKVVIDFLAPVFNVFAVIIKGVVDVLAPVVEFVTALGVAIYDVFEALIGWIPVTDILSSIFEAVGMVMKLFAQTVGFVIASLLTGIGKVLSWIPGLGSVGKGIENAGKKLGDYSMGKGAKVGIEKGSSFGAAVREVQNVSISGIGDEIRKSALMAGANQLSQEQLLSGINDKLGKDALADAFAAGIAKEKGKKMPAPPLPQKHDVVAGGEFDLGVQPSV